MTEIASSPSAPHVETPPFVTRFAPSPTGYLHLGHAYSALLAYEAAQKNKGTFLLRIEDIDPVRCKPEFTQAIYEDLHALGLKWPTPVRLQSAHMADYRQALDVLRERGLIYPCFCSRSDILREAAAATHAPHFDEGDGTFHHDAPETLYAGTCRNLSPLRQKELMAEKPYCWRLDVGLALQHIASENITLKWHDEHQGWIEAHPQKFGDFVVARKDIPTSYHLSVVTDDARQGVTHIIRGHDLFRVTDIHCLLQKLLGLPTPIYAHHELLCDAQGRRYAKRNQSITLRALREKGFHPHDSNSVRNLAMELGRGILWS